MAYLSGSDWTMETPKTYIVLGYQRSGTSFLANALLDFLNRDTYLIAIFKRPDQVANSLVRKGQTIDKRTGEKHAKEYGRRILGAVKEFIGV